jgi:uncharacterized membrane protein YccC
MAAGSPSLSPLWRQSLRIWLATTLTIGILLWSGRGHVLGAALVMAVLFVNENDLTPARSIGQQVAGALVGILTAQVVHELSTSWLALGIALLLTGVLVRGLGLLRGLGTGYMGCWALELMHRGNQVNWAVIFDLGFAVVVGIVMAQFATWALWPRRPLQQLPALDAQIASQLAAQVRAMRAWLVSGGPPPPPLRSQDLLPRIQLLQQLRDQTRSRSSPAHTRRLLARWAQGGSLWRQLLRQWLLLEPLLRQLPSPLPLDPQARQPLLINTLNSLSAQLQGHPGSSDAKADADRADANAALWLEQASGLGASKPLLLAIGQQCQALHQLLEGRALLQAALSRCTQPPR